MLNNCNKKRIKISYTIKNFYSKISLRFEKIISRIKDKFRFLKMDLGIIVEVISNTFIVIIITILVIWIMNLLYGSSYFQNNTIVVWLIDNLSFCVNNYNEFLLACLGLAGFLTALFLSGLSSVITSSYTDDDLNIYISILQEYKNKKYFQSMINYLVVIIIQLLFLIIGVYINPLISIIMVAYTVKMIYVYFKLSLRVFFFTDISTIAQVIYQEICLINKRITKAIRRKKPNSIIMYYKKVYLAYLSMLKSLGEDIKTKTSTSKYKKYNKYLLAIVVEYSKLKNIIPTKSGWYDEEQEETYWYEANATEVSIGVKSGTFIKSKTAVNINCLEEKICEINFQSICKLIDSGNIDDIEKCVDYYVTSKNIILKNTNNFDYWEKYSQKIESTILSMNTPESKTYESIAEQFCMDSILLIINMDGYVNKIFEQYFSDRTLDLPQLILEELPSYRAFISIDINELMEQLMYEVKIERKTISSTEYIAEQIAYHYINDFKELISIAYKVLDNMMIKANELYTWGRTITSWIYRTRIIEIVYKIETLLSDIEGIYIKLCRIEKNLIFTKIDFEKKKEDIRNIKYTNLFEYAKNFKDTKVEVYKNEELDYCGQIFYQLIDAIFETMIQNDYENFKKLYKEFALICDAYMEYIAVKVNPKQNFYHIFSNLRMPFIMYMTINGYLIYHSHLIKDAKWESEVKENFELLVKRHKNKQKFMAALVDSVKDEASNHKFSYFNADYSIRYEKYINDKKLVKVIKKNTSMSNEYAIESTDSLITGFTNIDRNGDIEFYNRFSEIFVVYYINPNLLDDSKKYKARFEL